jgi:hypothetical protein
VTPTGAKLWNFTYRFDGKQRKLVIGPYPNVSLKEAKRQLTVGLHASQEKRITKLAKTAEQVNTFQVVAAEFLEKKRDEGRAAATIGRLSESPCPGAGDLEDLTARRARERRASRRHWRHFPVCGHN